MSDPSAPGQPYPSAPGYQPPQPPAGGYPGQPVPPAGGYPPPPQPAPQPAYPPAPAPYPPAPAYPASAPPAYPAAAPPAYPASAPPAAYPPAAAPGYPGAVPPGYPPAGGLAAPGVPAPKKKKTGMIIGIILGVVALLIIGCGATFFFVLRSAVSGPQDTVNAWLTAAKDGNVTRLNELSCKDNQYDMTDDELDEEFNSSLTWDITSTSITNDTAEVVADLKMTVSGDVERTRVTFELEKESGDWKVCDATAD